MKIMGFKMPIHEFGQFKKIKDTEKEIEKEKVQEIKLGPFKRTQEPKSAPIKTNHPLVHGGLEIEEEEL